MRVILIYLFLFCCSIVGCGGGSDEKANFRFINLFDEPVDLLLNSKSYVEDLPSGDFVDYKLIRSEQVEFVVLKAGGFNEVGSVKRKIDTASDYTLVAFGSEGNSTLSLIKDQNIPPPKTRGMFRFINGREPVDIYIGTDKAMPSTPSLSNLRTRGVSSYIEGPAGNFRIIVRRARGSDIIFDSGVKNLNDGEIWSVLVFNKLKFLLDRERK